MICPPDASTRSSSVNTTEWYRWSGAPRLDARAAYRVERDAAERIHRGHRAEEPRLRTFEDDDDDEARIVRGDETCERRHVCVVEVTPIVAWDLCGAGLPRDAEPRDRGAVRDAL